jgi:hypothetical protein
MGKGGREVVGIERFSGRSCCDGFSDGGFLYCSPQKPYQVFLKLVELCKGLIVLSCLVSSIEMNETSRPIGK